MRCFAAVRMRPIRVIQQETRTGIFARIFLLKSCLESDPSWGARDV